MLVTRTQSIINDNLKLSMMHDDSSAQLGGTPTFHTGLVSSEEEHSLGLNSPNVTSQWIPYLGCAGTVASDCIIAIAMCLSLKDRRTGLKRCVDRGLVTLIDNFD